MSFKEFMALNLLLAVLAIALLPLWAPFWLYIMARNWWDERRYEWECIQWNREYEAKRASSSTGGVHPSSNDQPENSHG